MGIGFYSFTSCDEMFPNAMLIFETELSLQEEGGACGDETPRYDADVCTPHFDLAQ